MSSTLMWKPVDPTENSLPDELKRAISRRLWDTDGSCGGGEKILDADDVEYITGLRDAGVKGATELIKAINKYGEVIVWHSH